MGKNIKFRLPLIAGVVFVVIVASLFVFFAHLLHTIDDHDYIFQKIEECSNLASYENDATVTFYNDPKQDNKYQGQPLLSFVGIDYQSQTMCFTLYAYVFENNDMAKQYYVNVTGQAYDNDYYVLKSGGTTHYQIVVAFENKAYRLETKNQYIKSIDSMLAERFSIKLR